MLTKVIRILLSCLIFYVAHTSNSCIELKRTRVQVTFFFKD